MPSTALCMDWIMDIIYQAHKRGEFCEEINKEICSFLNEMKSEI